MPSKPLPSVPSYAAPVGPSADTVAAQFAQCAAKYSKGFGSFTSDSPDHREDYFSVSTRDNGDVGEGEAGNEDKVAGLALRANISKEFPALLVAMEVVDEWVCVEVRREPKSPPAPPPYPAIFWQGVLDYLVELLAENGIPTVGAPEVIQRKGHKICLRIPVMLYGSKNYGIYRKTEDIFVPHFRKTPFTVGCGYIAVGTETMAVLLETRPTWAK